MAAGIRTIKLTLSASDFRRGVKSVNTSLAGIQTAAAKTQGAVNRLTKVYAGLFALGIVKNFAAFNVEMATSAESVDLLGKKLSTLTDDAEALQKVLDSADRVGVAFEDLGNTVGRFALVTKGAFAVDELLDFAEGIILSGRLVGSTQKEIQSGLLQLSQGFGKSRLDGDELKSVMESLPIVAQELAKVLGINIGQLKEWGAEGKISSAVIAEGLANLNERVKDLPGLADTVGSEVARISNELKLLIGNVIGSSDNLIKDMLTGFADLLKALNDNSVAVAKWGRILTAPFRSLGALYDIISGIVDLMPTWVNAMVGATVALWAIDAAGISVTATFAALNATTGLLNKSLLLLSAFAAGFTFGTYLSEQFLEVRLAGIAMVNGVLKALEFLKLSWASVTAGMKFAWNEFVGFFGDGLFSIVEGYKELLILVKEVPGFGFAEGLIDTLSTFQTQIQTTGGSLREYNTAISNANQAYASSISTIDAITDSMAAYEIKISAVRDAEKDLTTTRKEGLGITDKLITNAEDLAKAEAKRLKAIDALEALKVQLGITDKAGYELGLTMRKLRELLDGGFITAADHAKGVEVAFDKLNKSAFDFGEAFQKSMEGAVVDGIDAAADAIIEFTKGGEDAFKKMTMAILEDIARIALRLTITQGLSQAFGFSPTKVDGKAKGDAFSGGNVIPFASGGIVTEPTIFPMAKGIGLMGEAGPEAIIPLTRNSDGDLGVSAEGLGGSPVTINIIDQSTGTETEQRVSPDGKTIDIIIKNTVQQGFSNGSFDKTLGANFGIRRAGQ